MYNWYQNIFHAIAVLIVFHAANGKKWKKTRLKQGSKSRKENQNVVVVANPPGSSSLRCRTAIATMLLCYCSAAAPLLLRCRVVVEPLSLRPREGINNSKLNCFCSTVASAVDRKVHTVVASRGIIRVTVTIGDCQARVSSSSEGCSTSQKTVKVETY